MDNHIDTGPLPPPPPPPSEARIDISETMEQTGSDPHAVPTEVSHGAAQTKYRQTYLDQFELNFPSKPAAPRVPHGSENNGSSDKASPVSGKMGDSDRRMPLTTAGLWEFLFRPFKDKIERFLESVQKTFTVLVLRDFDPVPVIHPDNIETIVEKFAASFIRQARKAWEIFLEGLPQSGHMTSNKGPVLLVPASSLEVMLENIYFTDLWRQLADVADDCTTVLLQNAGDDRTEHFRSVFLSRDIKTRTTAIVMREVCNIALGNDTAYVLEDYFTMDTTSDLINRVIDSVRRETGQMLSVVATPGDLQVAFGVLHMLSYGKAVDLSGLRMEGEWPLVVSMLRRYGDSARPVVRAAIAADPNLLLQDCPLFPPDVAVCVTRPTVLEICIVDASDVIPAHHCDVILDCCSANVLNQPICGLFSQKLKYTNGALPLTLAAMYQGQQKVKDLLTLGASVFSMDENGTILHCLIALHGNNGNTNTVTSLRSKCDVMSCINHVLNAHIEDYDLGEGHRDTERVTYQRALLSALSPAGYTPLEDAVRYQCPDIIDVIMNIEHVTCKSVLSNSRLSMSLIDMTEFERNSFRLSEANACHPRHKSCRSRFASDMIFTHTPSHNGPVLANSIARDYASVKFKQYYTYYMLLAAVHLVAMVIVTLTGVYFPRPWLSPLASANISNASVIHESNQPVTRGLVIAGEVIVSLYALLLLVVEIYDSARFTNFKAEGKHVLSMIRFATLRQPHGTNCRTNTYSLYSSFRVMLAVFALLVLTAMVLRVCGTSAVVVAYGLAVVVGLAYSWIRVWSL